MRTIFTLVAGIAICITGFSQTPAGYFLALPGDCFCPVDTFSCFTARDTAFRRQLLDSQALEVGIDSFCVEDYHVNQGETTLGVSAYFGCPGAATPGSETTWQLKLLPERNGSTLAILICEESSGMRHTVNYVRFYRLSYDTLSSVEPRSVGAFIPEISDFLLPAVPENVLWNARDDYQVTYYIADRSNTIRIELFHTAEKTEWTRYGSMDLEWTGDGFRVSKNPFSQY